MGRVGVESGRDLSGEAPSPSCHHPPVFRTAQNADSRLRVRRLASTQPATHPSLPFAANVSQPQPDIDPGSSSPATYPATASRWHLCTNRHLTIISLS